MAAQESPRLGVCPSCGEEILPRHVLIRYETTSGEEEAWTECPGCGEVVHPT
ncbi:phage terminase large subunit family protein [Natronomonas gomsonensis]|uniref:phage terminase large subunit family protein n=1 Tax=Natronomonas gomsonensis TaxID=1046043 RepID=UPI0020CA72DA|nr:phage terminase large subunit family protein [Natronomonas gomsonensis]